MATSPRPRVMTPRHLKQRSEAGKKPKPRKGKRNLASLLGEMEEETEENLPVADAGENVDLDYLPVRVKRALAAYKNGLPVSSWQDAKAQQATVAEALGNEARLVDLEMQRGKLFSLDEIRARDERHDELFINALNEMANWAAKQVPLDEMNDTRKRALDKVAEIRANIAEELGRKK